MGLVLKKSALEIWEHGVLIFTSNLLALGLGFTFYIQLLEATLFLGR